MNSSAALKAFVGEHVGAVCTLTTARAVIQWALDLGGKHDLGDGARIGGFASFFYERDSAFYDDGVDDSYWKPFPDAPFQPETSQGFPEPGGGGSYLTSLFDVTQGMESVQWGGLGTLGMSEEEAELYDQLTAEAEGGEIAEEPVEEPVEPEGERLLNAQRAKANQPREKAPPRKEPASKKPAEPARTRPETAEPEAS